jgi:serine/threonine protein kinase
MDHYIWSVHFLHIRSFEMLRKVSRLENPPISKRMFRLKKVNQFLLLQTIGEGSTSKVYLSRDVITNEFYAVKRVRLESLSHATSGLSQLQREIGYLRSLTHPNLVRLIEVIHVESDDCAYLVLEYASCGCLSSVLKSGHQFTQEALRSILHQLVLGVAHLHGLGLVHQDIKPKNILLCGDGRCLISDLGNMHTRASPPTTYSSPAYQAPESTAADLEPDVDSRREDIWSLGVTFFEVAFGRLPFEGETMWEIGRVARETQLVRPPDCDSDFWNLIRGMLDVNPRTRFVIQQVANHSYFQAVGDPSMVNVPYSEIPCSIDGRDIDEVCGVVCDSDHQFAAPHRRETLRSFRPPFEFPE